MSDTANALFESLRAAKQAVHTVVPGLKDLVPQVKAELSRLGTQGSMELASALFSGHGFVPYGPGQYTPTPEHDHGRHGSDNGEPTHEHGPKERGMER